MRINAATFYDGAEWMTETYRFTESWLADGHDGIKIKTRYSTIFGDNSRLIAVPITGDWKGIIFDEVYITSDIEKEQLEHIICSFIPKKIILVPKRVYSEPKITLDSHLLKEN